MASETRRDVISIRPEATLLEAASVLTKNKIGALILKGSGGALAGIISERDIVLTLAGHGAAALTLAVAACMTKEVATCGRRHNRCNYGNHDELPLSSHAGSGRGPGRGHRLDWRHRQDAH
jgi:hypothetical protein